MNEFYTTLEEFKKYVEENIGPYPELSDNEVMMLVVFYGFMQRQQHPAACIHREACIFYEESI